MRYMYTVLDETNGFHFESFYPNFYQWMSVIGIVVPENVVSRTSRYILFWT